MVIKYIFLDWIHYLAHKSCKSITYYKFYIYANSLQNIGHRNGEWNRWYDISCLSLPKWLFGHTTFVHLHISITFRVRVGYNLFSFYLLLMRPQWTAWHHDSHDQCDPMPGLVRYHLCWVLQVVQLQEP